MAFAENLFVDGPAGRLSVRTKGLEKSPGNVAVLVQGSNLSGQTGYDFSFAGGQDYSMMDAIVDRPGPKPYGAVTFALRGYGASAPPVDPLACGTDSAVEDLAAVMDWLEGKGYAQAALVGWSWGARIIGHYVARYPGRASHVAFLGPAIGGGDPVLPAPTEPWWFNTRDEYRNRLDPAMMDADAFEALIEHIATSDPRAPNAIRVENARGSVPIDPNAITCPALLIYGSEGGKAVYMKGVVPSEQFFERLATRNKMLAVVPDSNDYAMFQRRRSQVQHIICSFLEAP
jgi:pimeloyl-ACP methyl ester carboxylesterase